MRRAIRPFYQNAPRLKTFQGLLDFLEGLLEQSKPRAFQIVRNGAFGPGQQA